MKVVELERLIPHPVERVFEAWLDPDTFAEWFLPDPAVRLGQVTADARVGGSFLIEMIVDGQVLVHTGVYRRIEHNRSLVFTWKSAMTGDTENVVEVWFDAREASTLLRLRHENLPNDESCERHAAGWAGIVHHLEQYLTARRSQS